MMSADELPPVGPLLVLSPHADDAALSCGVLLERADAVHVMTVFGGVPDPPRQGHWDRTTGFADAAASGLARREEEAAAFGSSPHVVSTLPLLDLQYIEGARPQKDAVLIAEAVVGWLDADEQATVALPAGAGRSVSPLRARLERRLRTRVGAPPHPDHLWVRDAALDALSGRPEVRIVLYEELPYRFSGPADRQVAKVAGVWGCQARLVAVSVERHAKAARIAAYASQLPHLDSKGGPLDEATALPLDERYWWLTK